MAVRIPILSRLTRLQRILLAVVAVVIVLFVVAVARPRDGDGGAADTRPGFVTWLGGLFGGSATVDPSALSGPCLQPDGRLVIDGTCALRVAAGDDDVRQVRLRAEAPITVRAPVPMRDSVGEQKVAAGDTIDVAVDADEQDITITCDAESPCVVSTREQ